MQKVLACLVVAAAVLAGCSSGGGTATASRPPASASPGSLASSSSPDPPSSSPSSGNAPQAAVVKQKTAPVPGRLKGTVVLGVSSVQVRGKLATVALTFSPTFAEESSDKAFSLFTINGDESAPVMSLVDPVNLKRYAVVKDSNDTALEPNVVGLGARNGGSATGTYTFAAPPDGVTALDVYFSDFPPLHDVPVTR